MAIDLGNTPTGTPPTAGEKLQIRSAIGVGTTDAPAFAGLSTTGNVGVGTASPASGLHVSGALGTNAITYDSAAALKLTNTTDGSSWMLTPGIVGVINGSFSIRNAGSSLTALAISNTGGVGIGLNSLPGAKLHITGGDQSTSFSAATIALSLGTTGTFPHFIHTRHNNVLNNNAIDFYTGDGNVGGVFPTNAIHGLTINNGSVGVGTTFPVADLDIAKTWNSPALAVTGASGTGTTATITFALQSNPIPVGSTIVIAGITPAGYNGTFVVTASSLTSVSYVNATTATYVSGGTIERVFTSVKLNVTDTASNAASKLMDIQRNGVSQFQIIKNTAAYSVAEYDGNVVTGYYIGSRSYWNAKIAAMVMGSQGSYNWSANGVPNPNSDTIGLSLFQDAPGILAQRNGRAAQAFRVYGDYIDANNSDYLSFRMVSGAFWIEAIKTGTGAARNLNIGTTIGAGSLQFLTNDIIKWSIPTAGHFLAANDNLYDIGASGANRPRDLYIGRDFYLGSDRSISFGTRSAITSAANGQMRLSNNAGNDFSILQLGGLIDAFPAIARDGAGIKITGAATGLTSWIKVPPVAVASLPLAATAGVGARSFVNDALSPVFGSAVTGGGAVTVPVYSTGSAWNVG